MWRLSPCPQGRLPRCEWSLQDGEGVAAVRASTCLSFQLCWGSQAYGSAVPRKDG